MVLSINDLRIGEGRVAVRSRRETSWRAFAVPQLPDIDSAEPAEGLPMGRSGLVAGCRFARFN